MNVTQAIQERDAAALRKDRLAEAHARFVERWMPRHRDDAHDFERDLMYLIHTTYEQAQEPFTRKYSAMQDVIASQPFIKPV